MAWMALTVFLTACGTEEATDDAPIGGTCNQRAPGRCGSDCTPVQGRPLDWNPVQAWCLDSSVPIQDFGCRSSELDCGLSLAFAVDETGSPWWFPDQCLPRGFELVTENLPDCD